MKEHEIRPEALLNRYVELSARDAERLFDKTTFAPVDCVACGTGGGEARFTKSGFAYAQCGSCGTLFQSPRPPIAAFEAFYRKSESSRYWAETFFPAVAEVRRDKIFTPRVKHLSDLCAERGIRVDCLIDVGAGYGIFLDEWRKLFPNTRSLAVEPGASLAAECRAKGFEVAEDIAENVKGHDGTADLVACFEVLEHVYDPLSFVRTLKKLARPGGYVFVSTLCIDGFDLQTLWDKSTQVSPPHHINFLSVRGFKRLFERAGLSEIGVTTPGKLDVDIVRNAAKKDASVLNGQRFLRELVNDDAKAAGFQVFLREQRLSSHAWVIGKKGS